MASDPRVLILMGSDSDWPVMSEAHKTLADFGVACEVHVSSAHRTPERTGKLAFGYLNKILHSWSEKGIKTVPQAKAESNPAKKAAALQSVEKSEFDRRILEQFMQE